MNKLINKNSIQKIVIAILIVLSFNFAVPTFSCADFGGLLWSPARSLITGVGDTIIYWLNFFFVGITNEQGANLLEYKVVVKSDDDNGFIDREGTYEIVNAENMGKNKEIPVIAYSPDMIFSNQIPGLDANYINPKKNDSVTKVSITEQLQSTISKWYTALRNFVTVCLLSVLLYVAIRMIISSSSSDKAKYKKMLMDWVISIFILYFMHYIMSFTMTLIEIITQGLSDSFSKITVVYDGGKDQFNTNIMGYCRFMSQSDEGIESMGFTILYVALIFYTLKFTWEYMKRSIKMAFLTLMAPLVTLTYAIDKMGDGKAQAFNAWLKEYIFTALVQPFHLIIYTIFMGASIDIAVANPLYAVLFLAFLTPAENLLRKFFRFDKEASGGSSFAGGFTGAAAFNALKGGISRGAQGRHGSEGGGGKNPQIRQKNNNTVKDPNAPSGNLDSFRNSQTNESGNDTPSLETRNEEREETPMEAMADVQSEAFGTSDWDPQEYAAMQLEESSPNATGNNIGSHESGQSGSQTLSQTGVQTGAQTGAQSETQSEGSGEENKWKQDENWGIGKWASENFVKPATTKVGNGIKNVANAAGDKFKSTGLYKRAIQPGTAKIKDIANKANQKYNNSKFVKSGAARALKNSAKGALHVGGHALAETAKVSGKIASGVALGAVGMGIGITGDNMEDVLKYAAGGFALGYSAVPNLAKNKAQEAKNLGNTIRNTYETGAFGETEAALRQQTRNIVNDSELRAEEKERMTRENNGVAPTRTELNARMRQVAEYSNTGITDSSLMHKAMKIEKDINKDLEKSNMNEEDRNSVARRQAIETAKIASQYSEKDLRDDGKVKGLKGSLVNKLTNGSGGLDKKQANVSADKIINNIKKIKGV